MVNRPTQFLSVWAMLLAATGAGSSGQGSNRGGDHCDSRTIPKQGDLGYRMRGNRCEGLYVQLLDGSPFWLASLTLGQRQHAPWSDKSMQLRWSIPPDTRTVLRGISLKRTLFYRMDMKIASGGRGEFQWPADVRTALGLTANDLGLLLDYEQQTPNRGNRVYVPVEIQVGTTGPVYATLLPTNLFQRFEYAVYRLDSSGTPTELLGQRTELPGSLFPPTVPIDFPLAQLPARGTAAALYRLDVKGTTRDDAFGASWWILW